MNKMEKKNNFLNRKTLRKMKRQEKKQKKDFFYKHKSNLDQNSKEAEKFVKRDNNKFSKMNLKFFNRKKAEKEEEEDEDIENEHIEKEDGQELDREIDPDDEEVDSDIPSDKDSDEADDAADNESTEEVIPKKTEKSTTVFSGPLEELDVEIKNLEKKLGLKDVKRKERFKKRVAEENYDEDLFDFLDNIEHIVKETKVDEEFKPIKEKKTKSKLAELEEKETLKESNIKPTATKPNLEDIKSQSRLFSNLKMNEDEKLKVSFQKDITALLNKISEANLTLMFPQFISKIESFENAPILNKSKRLSIIYEIVSKMSIKMTLDQEVTNLPITSCICSYLSVLHYKFGNSFLLYFMKSVYDKVQPIIIDYMQEITTNSNKSILKNFIFLIIHFYILKNLTSKMYFDIIKLFIENFNSVFSEMLLILLSYIGIEIRKEDAESLKEIISSVNKKYNLIKLNANSNVGKIKYIVDMIDDIKNNKYLKFNLSEKFNFFKTFVNSNKNNYTEGDFDLSSSKIADRIDLSWESMHTLDKNKIEDLLNSNETKPEQEILVDFNNVNQELDSGMFVDNNLLEKKMRKFKMTTDLKKMIFTAITSATDCNDAFERLMRLNLKRDQSREIIKILVLLTTEEKCYNPFYRLLLNKLITFEKDHKYTFHYTIWDYLKVMDGESFTPKKIHNLGKLCGELLAEEKISLPVFLNFEFEDAEENQRNFLTICFDKYFEKVNNPDKCKIMFAKLVKNDDHVEFAKRLFYFLANDVKNNLTLENKSEIYIECYTAATKVLKRIL